MKEFCNPMNIEYKYQHYHDYAHRESADPTLVYFNGKYYIFPSMCLGFYYSDDMVNWEFYQGNIPEAYAYAPDVCVVGDYLVFCASSKVRQRTFWRTTDPLGGKFEPCCAPPFYFFDPAMFTDDDGRIYFYWGCDCGIPLYGIELDKETLMPIGEEVITIRGDFKNHGWERREYPGKPQQELTPEFKAVLEDMAAKGIDRQEPHVEGSYMNKINGKYYLQYAAPATELDTYGNGVYVSDSPLGPFKYQAHNPMSSKPGGFICGAGHGSTEQDEHGNFWHTATMCISQNAMFERRLGLFPAGVDDDGILFCNQNYADWPVEVPEGKFDCRTLSPKWMLLSYKKTAEASSSIDGHTPEMALDECIKTSWCAKGSKGEWYMLDLGRVYDVHSVQINFQDVEVPLKQLTDDEQAIKDDWGRFIDPDRHCTRYLLEGSCDKSEWFTLCDKSGADTDLSHDYLVLDEKVRYIKITSVELPYNERFALSGLRVFGLPTGTAPKKVINIKAQMPDATTAKLSWDKADGAIGYNVRYGIAPDKLYCSHMLYSDTEVLLTMLNTNTDYYYCIDAFGEGGITEGEVIKLN